MVQSKDRRPDQDADTEPSTMQTVESVIDGLVRLWRRMKAKIKRGPVVLVIGSFFLIGGGASADRFIHLLSASDPPGAPGAVSVETNIARIGVIDNVTITDTDDPSAPNPQGHVFLITVKFPNPKKTSDCDDQCEQALSNILGTKECVSATCTATFKDVDEGKKTNSRDIYIDCQAHRASKQKVLIVF